MAMRLSEVHPALVHFPIALLPVSIAADAGGRLRSDDRDLYAVGRVGIVLAAIGAAVAGTFGFIAQEDVELDDESLPILQTHRTLNVAALGALVALALARSSARRPSTAYILAGLGATALMSFSAYLGSKLVYTHGVAVEKAGGTGRHDLTVLPPERKGIAKIALRQLASGLATTVREMSRGAIVPYLSRGARVASPPKREPPAPSVRPITFEDRAIARSSI